MSDDPSPCIDTAISEQYDCFCNGRSRYGDSHITVDALYSLCAMECADTFSLSTSDELQSSESMKKQMLLVTSIFPSHDVRVLALQPVLSVNTRQSAVGFIRGVAPRIQNMSDEHEHIDVLEYSRRRHTHQDAHRDDGYYRDLRKMKHFTFDCTTRQFRRRTFSQFDEKRRALSKIFEFIYIHPLTVLLLILMMILTLSLCGGLLLVVM